MSISNIERFDKTVTQVLAELRACFPVPKTLSVSEFILTEEGAHDSAPLLQAEADLGAADPEYQRKVFASASLQWLVSEGYISSDGWFGNSIRNVVLTAKGLDVLGVTPSSLLRPQ